MIKHLTWLLTVLAVLSLCLLLARDAGARPPPCTAPGITERHDHHLRLAARRQMPSKYDWCWLKALCQTESNLDPNAESPAGAVGLCQVMRGTWADMRGRGPRTDAKRNAEVAARYWARLDAFWSTPRSVRCSTRLILGSYNSGPGNVLRAQELSGGRLCWEDISGWLHEVTGDHARETRAYVWRVQDNYLKLRGFD